MGHGIGGRRAVLTLVPMARSVVLQHGKAVDAGGGCRDVLHRDLVFVELLTAGGALVIGDGAGFRAGRRDRRDQLAVIVRAVDTVVNRGDHIRLVGGAQLRAAGAAPVLHRARRGADRGRNCFVMRPVVPLGGDLNRLFGGEGLAADGRRGGKGHGAGRQVLRVHDRGPGYGRGQRLRIVVLFAGDHHGGGIGIAAFRPGPVGVGGRRVGVAGGSAALRHGFRDVADVFIPVHRHRGGIIRMGVFGTGGFKRVGNDRRCRRDGMRAVVAGKGGGHGPAAAALGPVAPGRLAGIAVRRGCGLRVDVGIGGDIVKRRVPRHRVMVIIVGVPGRQSRGGSRFAVSDMLRRADLFPVQVVEFHLIGPGHVGILRGIGRRAGDRRHFGRPAVEGIHPLRGLVTVLGPGGRGGRLPVVHRRGGALRALRRGVVPGDLIGAQRRRVGGGIGLPRVGVAHHGHAARGEGGRPHRVGIVVLRVGGLRRNGGNGKRIAVVLCDLLIFRTVIIVERYRAGLFHKVDLVVFGDGLLDIGSAFPHVRARVGIGEVIGIGKLDEIQRRHRLIKRLVGVHPFFILDFIIIESRGLLQNGIDGGVVDDVVVRLGGHVALAEFVAGAGGVPIGGPGVIRDIVIRVEIGQRVAAAVILHRVPPEA